MAAGGLSSTVGRSGVGDKAVDGRIMAGRDDGEFELILGNKQLLSVLFIVIVLLGVFWTGRKLAGLA